MPLERVDIAVVLFEYFGEAPILNIWLHVGREDKDLCTVGADCNHATIRAPSEALNTWQDAVLDRCCLRFLTCHIARGGISSGYAF